MANIPVDPNLDKAQRKVSTTNLANFAGVDCQLLVVKETHRPVIMDGTTAGGAFQAASVAELEAAKTELTQSINTKQPSGDYLTKSEAASTYATKSEKVQSAATADNATHATSADSATNATNATNAVKASQDASGNVITTTYATKTELAGKANASHTHATSEVTGLDTALAGKANASHTHEISDVTNLQTTLNGKVLISGSRGQLAGYEQQASYVTNSVNIGYLSPDSNVCNAENNATVTVNLDGGNVASIGEMHAVKILRIYNTTSTTNITFNKINGITAIDFFGEDAPTLAGKYTIYIVADFNGANVSLRITQY